MKVKVLIVDRDEGLLDGMARHLVAAGFDVTRASNGLDAMLIARKFRPNVVITEVDLPKVDGLELARSLKSKSETKDITIIFISDKTDPETLKAAKNAGAVKFLAKPFAMENLVSVLMSRFPTHGKGCSGQKA